MICHYLGFSGPKFVFKVKIWVFKVKIWVFGLSSCIFSVSNLIIGQYFGFEVNIGQNFGLPGQYLGFEVEIWIFGFPG